MIGKIKGILTEIDGNVGLIETASGVFYNVYLPNDALACLYPCAIEMYTYLQVRDDALVLFGFQTKQEYQLFTLLLTVPGVGPKSAFNVISHSKPKELIAAVTTNDATYFTKVPGLGKKGAMKIILELSQKLKTEFKLEQVQITISDDDKTVIDALVSLGFRVNDAKQVISQLSPDLSIEEKIQHAIRLATNPKK